MDGSVSVDLGIAVAADFQIMESFVVAKVKSLLRWVPPSEPHTGFLVQANLGSVADPAAPTNDVGNVSEADLRVIIPGAAGERYSFAVAAYNAAGNIGDPGLLEDVVVDFTVPGAPTGLEIVAS